MIKALNKLDSFFSADLEKTVADVIILQNSTGGYELFNKYDLYKENNFVKVMVRYTHTIKEFSSLKVAMSWCIYDKRNKITEAKRLEQLDQLLTGINVAINSHKKTLSVSKNIDHKLIVSAKLSNDQHKKKLLTHEISGLIQNSKNWQLSQFNKN